MDIVTRFAPSPTGRLHLGHAYSALFAAHAAHVAGGRFLVRMENIDTGRCRPEFEAAILEDLNWLGLTWQSPVRRQSDHMADYGVALDRLDTMGLLYPCFCTRKDIAREIADAGHAPHDTPDGLLYPGTCRDLGTTERLERRASKPYALRLNMAAALDVSGPLQWHDQVHGAIQATPEIFGDVVLARKDTPTSYHLAVTLDDHLQGVSLVTRGEDLFSASHVHRLLQALLELETPRYHHHRLLSDDAGKRFAKRDNAATLQAMREAGIDPATLRRELEIEL